MEQPWIFLYSKKTLIQVVFNNIPDSGVIRSVPLVISYDNSIYSSLALENGKSNYSYKRVIINYDENVGKYSIKWTKNSNW